MVKCILIFLVTLMGVMGNVADKQYNKVEFKHLCKILRVAEGEPQKIPDELGKFTDVRRVLNSLLRATKTSTATYQKVIRLSSSDNDDADFISYTVKRRLANEKIKHTMGKVNEIFSRIEEELIQARKERTQARNSLVHAIYGAQVGEIPKDQDISSVLENVSRASIFNRWGGELDVDVHEDVPKEPTCGATTGEGAGFTLINDFYCLCVGKDNDKAVCHKGVKGPGTWIPEG
ncbi:Variant surface glycoprotein, partial [Trypanosoma congolense IL3000]